MSAAPTRIDGYAPVRDYAAIGNNRTLALVALDGAIDWLPLPDLDRPPVFCALLDSRSGGSFRLAPVVPFTAERRYAPATNVVETTFHTAGGSVRVTDALTHAEGGSVPWNEVARRIEGVSGEVGMRWVLEPRFGWHGERPETERRHDAPVLRAGGTALALQSFDAGEPSASDGRVTGEAMLHEGDRALLALGCFHEEPVALSRREEVERRMDDTFDHWRRRAGRFAYDGPWHEAVLRSGLALELLLHEPTGALAAAGTTSLPEAIGGNRNWDYRYGWLRDSSFALEAMTRLRVRDRVHTSLSWALEASGLTSPRLDPFYKLDGRPGHGQTDVGLPGYRGSAPVYDGNQADTQLQLGNYGDLLNVTWGYVQDGNALDPASCRRLADAVDFVCEVWTRPDSSIWELGDRRHYTQGKLAAWIALDRGLRLAAAGELPGHNTDRWRRTADEVRAFIDKRCWSDDSGAYVRDAGHPAELDAGVLLMARTGYPGADRERLNGTIEAVRRELGRGPLLYRYTGMADEEGAFLACSFWLVEALAAVGRIEEAHETMDALVALANDVGLYSEEIDPETGELLGNMPQALTHLALVNAAFMLHEGRPGEGRSAG